MYNSDLKTPLGLRDTPLLAWQSLAFQGEATEGICTAYSISRTADRMERPWVHGGARTRQQAKGLDHSSCPKCVNPSESSCSDCCLNEAIISHPLPRADSSLAAGLQSDTPASCYRHPWGPSASRKQKSWRSCQHAELFLRLPLTGCCLATTQAGQAVAQQMSACG